jgi:hypothetical protein
VESTFLGLLGFAAIGGFLIVIPYWKICMRTGISPAFSLLCFVPLCGVFVPWFIAFAQWPRLPDAGAPGHLDRPKKGVMYTPGEIEEFKRRGLM